MWMLFLPKNYGGIAYAGTPGRLQLQEDFIMSDTPTSYRDPIVSTIFCQGKQCGRVLADVVRTINGASKDPYDSVLLRGIVTAFVRELKPGRAAVLTLTEFLRRASSAPEGQCLLHHTSI